ncbi:TonB-dependent receptor [Azomonas macrocytogenes]|uniref:Catecholate siderophore receptor n=1 Tax=Azomonas macrocytogenes TaxID=69962 RepID=A0A839T3X0_AZOMA|nr:TonB-dependent siderophore receptor [Azomonas macrocytogenes]MBB3104237.1 catecholate siderophore receptor [Azomonas macrocytogenes]
MSIGYKKKISEKPPYPAFASAISLAMVSWVDTSLAETSGTDSNRVLLDNLTISGEQARGYKVDHMSSPKQTAPLLDTPQTINVIPETLYREQAARTLTEVLKNTPGISFNAGENGFATSSNNFQMRGFDTSGNIFINGSRDSGSYTRDVFNVEQVEVVKGPAADNGRGGAGGYINMVTKVPTLDSFIGGVVNYGFDQYRSEDRKRATLDINQALTSHTAARLNLMLENSGIPGREHTEKNGWGLAPSLALGLGTKTRAIFAFDYVEQNDRPDWGVPGATVRYMDRHHPSAGSGDRDEFYGLDSDYDDTTSYSIMTRFEHDLSDSLNLSNQTRWSRVSRDARYTIPTGYVPATRQATTQTQFYDRDNYTFSNLTNLSARFLTGSVKHNLAAGLEFTLEKSESNGYPTVNGGNTTINEPDRNRPSLATPPKANDSKVKIDTVALYAYDTAEFNEHWQLTGGVRLENYRVRIDSKLANGTRMDVDGYDNSEFTLGGKLGVVYKPAKNGSIYAAFGVSHQPPGSYLSNPDISRPDANVFPGFVEGADPVVSYNYEIGTKWDLFKDRLSTTAALFYTEKKDVPITGRDLGETRDTQKGDGKQVVYGLELSATGKVTDNWNVFGGLMLMQSERRHSARMDRVRRNANSADYGTHTRTDGDDLAFTPEVTANLWTTYRLPFGVTIGGGLQHVGSSYLGRPDDANRIVANGLYGKLPSYTIYNLMASYDISPNIGLRLNIDNLTNEEYPASANWNGTRVAWGPPRVTQISTDFKF